jgi:hypothetical protein
MITQPRPHRAGSTPANVRALMELIALNINTGIEAQRVHATLVSHYLTILQIKFNLILRSNYSQ